MERPINHSVAEDVIKYFRSQLVGTNAQWTHFFTKKISLEQVCNGIVSHVDSGIRKRLDQELIVPRKLQMTHSTRSYSSSQSKLA